MEAVQSSRHYMIQSYAKKQRGKSLRYACALNGRRIPLISVPLERSSVFFAKEEKVRCNDVWAVSGRGMSVYY